MLRFWKALFYKQVATMTSIRVVSTFAYVTLI